MTQLLWDLFITFFVIGAFNFGGGGAMLSLIQAQVVSVHSWISEETFANIVAISQSTPGPIGINCATYVGYEVFYSGGYGTWAGILGSCVATFAVVLPSFLLFFAIVKFYQKFSHSTTFQGVMSAMRPAVAGMIGAAALVLMFRVDLSSMEFSVVESNFMDWRSWLLFAAGFAVTFFTKISPIWILLAAGALGLLIF